MDESLNIVWKPIGDLKPYPNNAKTHPKEQIKNIAVSLKKYGWRQPVVIDGENNIVVGHGRVLAAKEAGIDRIPTLSAADLTEDEIREYRIIDNKTNESPWDLGILEDEIRNLDFSDFSLDFDIDHSDLASDHAIQEDEIPEVTEPRSKSGDLYRMGKHRLLVGDATKAEDVARLCEGEEVDMCLTDPPYGVSYVGGTGMTIENDSIDDDNEFTLFLQSAFAAADKVMKPGAAFYIWHADSRGAQFRNACEMTKWKIRECLIWVKNALVLGRQDYQWRHEPCQPAGTMVLTPYGEKPIEKLTDRDTVISYYTQQNELRGLRDGTEITTAHRRYTGILYGVEVAGRKTWATNNHQFSIKFNPETKNAWCTYLMRKGKRWRVGATRTYDARGFGLKHRVDQERAEEAWIIDVFESQSDAQIAEQLIAVKYGIPYTHWETREGLNPKYNQRTEEQIDWLYENLDLDTLGENAVRLLDDYGRDVNFPLIDGESKREAYSCRVTARINACNLIPGLMLVPVVADDGKTVEFRSLEKVDHKEYDGEVYSLAVKYYEHYVSDGIVTHNCLYGWKEGTHHWYSDRSQTTVLEFDKPTKNPDHPTMKPVELFAYLIGNSTRPGDIVLDMFSGSGTTLVACEQMDRTAFVMEMDPKYADVIIARWEELTGQKAELVSEAKNDADLAF